MEVRVAGDDAADAMLAHEHRSMQVMHHVAAQVGQFAQRLLQHGRMAQCRFQQCNPWRGQQRVEEAERRARTGGASRIELTSGAQRTEAHAFYRACGYKDSSVRFVKLLGA